MKTKSDDVNLWGLAPEMQPVLKLAEQIWQAELGIEDLVITSARDGIHSAGSLHYYGYAVDLRTWDRDGVQITDYMRELLGDMLRAALASYSSCYDVIVHKTHIHVEYDYIRAGLIR